MAAVALLAALAAMLRQREGLAFAAAAAGIAAATGALFTALYPNVLPSTISAAYTLTTGNAASTAKTLAVMTVVACIFLPFVLGYQAWTYWVFRKRLGAPPQLRRRSPRPAAADGQPVKPFDPRLLRHARPARLPVAAVAGLGVAAAGLIIVQAQLLADGIALRHCSPAGRRLGALRGVLAGAGGRAGRAGRGRLGGRDRLLPGQRRGEGGAAPPVSSPGRSSSGRAGWPGAAAPS